MNIIDFIRMLRNNLVLLIIVPLIIAGMVAYMTRKPDLKFSSETTLYTGIATGSSVDMQKSVNSLISNTAFDNLINVIKSRATQQEVAIRLLAQHLLLEKPDRRYILPSSFAELKRITPQNIRNLVVKDSISRISISEKTEIIPGNAADTTLENKTFSFRSFADSTMPVWLPPSINMETYELTVKNLTEYMHSSDTNFVYKLLNYSNPHYSLKAISSLKVQRIAFSDLVKLSYESNDPGICQQTLALFTDACIENYRILKENRSDVVIKYFEFQLKQAAERLDHAEDKLLKFNLDNNIINYYEQSKAIAGVKEQLDLDYNNKKVSLAGILAAIIRLEEKLKNQEQIQLKSSTIIELRDQLGALSYSIAYAENRDTIGEKGIKNLAELKNQSEIIKKEISDAVGELYKFGNTTDGLPMSSVLNDWISNVIAAENLKAGLVVMAEKIKDFQKQYGIYAPAGANLKRIEREISVSEQEYLELLHELNQAKLKMQDNELSSNIKTIDPPYYPLSPMPNNRKLLIMVGAVVGFVIVMFAVLFLEYFDETLKSQKKAARILKLPSLGIVPKILFDIQGTNFVFITNRLLEIIIQNTELIFKSNKVDKVPKILLFFSCLRGEGKSVVIGNLAQKLKNQGKRILVLNYSRESLLLNEKSQIGYDDSASPSKHDETVRKKPRKSMVRLLLGYPDTRVDIDSPFLEKHSSYLGSEEYIVYDVNKQFQSLKSYQGILQQNGKELSNNPDFVLIELPPILSCPYPVSLLSEADIPVMVCRSNRNWTEADQLALDVFAKLTDKEVHFILNGVQLQVIESVLGDLPKKRSRIRRLIKKLFRFHFASRYEI